MWPFGFGNRYPYTDFHELNLDWVLDKIRGLEDAMKHFVVDTTNTIISTVNKWLDDHPEATTTVQDGAITVAKLNTETIEKIVGIPIENGSDLDEYVESGKFICDIDDVSSIINKPITAFGDEEKYYPSFNLYVTKLDDEILQIYEVPELDYIGTRVFKNGSWSDWKFISEEMIGNEKYNVRTTALSDGIMGELMDCANTYINHESALFYGIGFNWDAPAYVTQADYEANRYGEQLFPDSVGRFKIDCSTLTWLLTSGIPWENSFYTGGGNVPKYTWRYDWSGTDWTMAGKFDIDRGLANVMAFHCFKNGYCFKPNKDFSNLKPGDLLFYNNSDEEGFWENIGHCSIFLGLDKSGEFISIEASENTDLPVKLAYNTIGSAWANKVIWCARLPMSSNVVRNPENLAQENGTYKDKTITGESNQALYVTNIEGGFKANRVYTAILKADIAADIYNNNNIKLLIQGDTGTPSLQTYGEKLDDGIFKFMFTTYGVRANRVTTGRIAAYLYDEVNDTTTVYHGTTGTTVYWLDVFEGVYDTDGYITPANVFDNTPSLQSGYSSGHAISANGTTDVSITFTKAYRTTPVISLTKGGSGLNFSTILKTCSTTGFTATLINHTSNEMTDRSFNWYAIGVNV